MRICILLYLIFSFGKITAQVKRIPDIQSRPYVSKVWVADNREGTYRNPVLHADYSDPDVIRVGDDYYMVASSFNAVPGLPVLHSRDLVNWQIIAHVLTVQQPLEHYRMVQHGKGVWAPSIRFHDHNFYIYYPDPDFGIYMVKSKDIRGPWSDPVLVEAGKGLIDPCPLWDDNGDAWLVHAFAGSRAAVKSMLVIKKMNAAGDRVLDGGTLVFDGHESDPTVEGPKLYRRNGYYYIFAPAGGVSTGWQLALRSRNIYGPYERKVVLEQGKSTINGPHQGAWVETQNGENWFFHFQDKGPYGRVVHLQPMKWDNDWPVIGIDKNGNGIGEPVSEFKKPSVGKSFPAMTPAESDEFNSSNIGLQWQWQANPLQTWAYPFPAKGVLRLFALSHPDTSANYWLQPNLLLQKFPAEKFTVKARISFQPHLTNDRTGIIIMGMDYASLSLKKIGDSICWVFASCNNAETGNAETVTTLGKFDSKYAFFRVKVDKDATCKFSYSDDDLVYHDVPIIFKSEKGKWVGARVGLFCTGTGMTNDSGFADIDWFRVE